MQPPNSEATGALTPAYCPSLGHLLSPSPSLFVLYIFKCFHCSLPTIKRKCWYVCSCLFDAQHVNIHFLDETTIFPIFSLHIATMRWSCFFWQQWVDTNWSSRPGAFHERSCNVWWIFLGPAPYLNLSTNHQEHLSSACFSFHNILIQFKLIQHFSFQIRQHQHVGWISGFLQLLQTSWWRKDWILIFANTLRVSWCYSYLFWHKIHSQAR